jgi:hypothetical protein
MAGSMTPRFATQSASKGATNYLTVFVR